MIASEDFLYHTRRKSLPCPAKVREPVVARSHANAAPSGSRNGAAASADNRAPSDPRPGKDDELARLGERIAELAERINAAEARMMTLIAEFDRRGGWKDGFGSCAEWLAWRIGIRIGPARERVRTARALENLPQTADALSDGSISYAKVRALTRVATPESETELLEFARAGSAAKLERTVRMWKKLSRDEELTAEQARHRSRAFSVFVDGDGMYVVKGRLEPEVGAVLMRAVEAASDALFRREREARDPRLDKTDPRPEPKQRRADAVGLLAERALAAGFGGGDPRDSRSDLDGIAKGSQGESAGALGEPDGGAGELGGDIGQSGHGKDSVGGVSLDSRNGSDPGPQARPRAESGSRAERYQVMVHCDAPTLAAEGEPGRSDLDGIRVSSETSRRMACDAAVVAMVHAKDGSVLSVGRRTRTIPPHIRRALEERDRGCRFPGCACGFTEAHHVKHWADGGETSLRNTLLLCRRHHRAVHEGQVKVSVATDGTVLFFAPSGKMLADAPGRPTSADAPKGRKVADAPGQRTSAGVPGQRGWGEGEARHGSEGRRQKPGQAGRTCLPSHRFIPTPLRWGNGVSCPTAPRSTVTQPSPGRSKLPRGKPSTIERAGHDAAPSSRFPA